jgi:ABC-2 type transport system ATP-binding protein
MQNWTFTAEAVTKRYGPDTPPANDDVTVRIEPGEVFGLLGPNGAGKSTLVKQIIGLLAPDSGSMRLGRHDLVEDPDAARQLCSYLPQAQMPIGGFKAREAIDITGAIRGGDSASIRSRRDELIEALDIGEWSDTLGARLSGGVKRLVGFAMVTVVPGRLVILDEPTNDVDPSRRRLLWEQVRRLGDDGIGVLLVTHNVLEAEKAVDRLAILDAGKILADGTPSSLKAADRGRLRLQVMLPPRADTPTLPEFVEDHTRIRNNLMAVIPEREAAAGIGWAQRLIVEGQAEEYALGATTLEDVYIRLTGDVEARNGVAA